MIQPDLIIFDCDGVLVDSEVLSCRCLSKILAGYGIDLGLDQALDLFLGRSVSAVVEHYQALGRSIPEQFSTELTRFVPRLLPHCPIEGVSPAETADPALRRRASDSIGCPSRFR
jgi:beta-phosphoglucomutase-like phosphatase (HAD superfamily)